MGSNEEMLTQAGFEAINVEVKEESREVIAQWMPGSGAEDYVVSANISATKPGATDKKRKVEEAPCCPTETPCCPTETPAQVEEEKVEASG
jgi:hypothetical protein